MVSLPRSGGAIFYERARDLVHLLRIRKMSLRGEDVAIEPKGSRLKIGTRAKPVATSGLESLSGVCFGLASQPLRFLATTLQGANQNSSLRSSDIDLFGSEYVVLIFWLKIPKTFHKLSFKWDLAKNCNARFTKFPRIRLEL